MSEDQNNHEVAEIQQTDASGETGGNPEGDDDRKLFVGGLSWETTEHDLKEYFEKYGKVKNCNLKKDLETMRSRGFGFVVFEEAESLEKVLAQEEKHVLQNKTIDPKRANPKGKFQEPAVKKIYVAKVDPSVAEDTIKEYFSQWGEIEKVEAPFDKENNVRRNFVFVEFKTEEAVDKVLNHTVANPEFKHMLGNEEVEIKKATPTGRGRGRGGFFRGGDRGRGRGGWGGYGGGWDYNQGYGYGGYGNGYGNYGYSGYGYGGYDGYGGYGGYGGWGGYDQSGYSGYGYGGYDYSGWGGYGDQSGDGSSGGQGAGYGKAPKNSRGGSSSYRPY